MKLQDYNIDNYVNWYRKLTVDIFTLDLKKERYKRLMLVSFSLNSRHIINQQNLRSKELEPVFKNAANKLDKEIKELDRWLLKINDLPFYYILTLDNWQIFDLLNNYEPLLEFINEKIKHSALPEIEVLKNELNKKNEEGLKLISYYKSGTPFIQKDANVFDFEFSNEVSNINYCKYLDKRIKEIEFESVEGTKFNTGLKWCKEQWQLSELVKALHTVKAFGDVTENEVKKAFEKMLNVDLKRHYTNINDLQDKRPKVLFTSNLQDAINNYLKDKKATN